MKMAKGLALMATGAGALVMYQKYNKPVMNKINQVVNKTKRRVDEELEDMM